MTKYILHEKVLIIEDCRDGHIATGQTGTYEGMAIPPDGDWKCPKIRLQDGSIIWGCECWWAPVREAGDLVTMQEGLAELKHAIIER